MNTTTHDSVGPAMSSPSIDARLDDYSIDFSQFPPDDDLPHPPSPQPLSDVGGPDDFTANLERYLLGEDDSEAFEKEIIPDAQKQPPPTIEDVPEDSEFGPPIDISTPSHLLRRPRSKDVSHLENVDEEEEKEGEEKEEEEGEKGEETPSVRRLSTASIQGDLRRQISDLQQTVRDRDEQLQRNHRRVLEAASAAEQIKHLQAELQRKSTMLDEWQAQRSDEKLLRDQIHRLQKQNEEKDTLLQRSSLGASELTALQNQISDMHQELQSRQSTSDREQRETVAHLRQQLSRSQDQLKERETALDEAREKLQTVAATHAREIEKLESDLHQAHQEYQTLQDRFVALEKNSTLAADLTRAQSQVTAHEQALKAMAADRSLETGGNTYSEILELIKDLGQPAHAARAARAADDAAKPPASGDLDPLHDELAQAQAELRDATSARKALELQLTRSQEQTTEAHTLINSIEGENTRLARRADDLQSQLNQTQHELRKARETERLQPPPERISALESSHRQLHDRLASAERRESELQTELQALRASQATHAGERQTLRAEIERLESAIAVKNETVAAVDRRVAQSVEKREQEWRRRVDLLLKERERMSRALMWSWGEKEVPEDIVEGRRKQGYRYKYVNK
ncbi:hypothetical protein EYZ11_004953 [Aspergillus tanneri]|uniref:Spindle pole body associated protein SnaD n=1 Tax=Aspergillus tanneri TaxID=1220188 RepID=A0A4S3JQ25_9EURO|nr:uncharacterized protein ATNIH1004_006289 [Aspergillus tanneri]KAA8647595.1 hypothetical protein ATNIH1004_006289 [Aspergillus tanneri]THC95581.1 hypothetical protein EYZ11_004953 [Aspergillus tanneri]